MVPKGEPNNPTQLCARLPPFTCALGRVAVIQHGRQHGSLEAGGGAEATTYDKRLDRAAPATSRLGDRDTLEQQPQLAVQEVGVSTAKYLRHEGPPRGQHVRCDVERCQKKLQDIAREVLAEA